MIKNYIKIAFRNLWKNPSYSFINIFGLAIGLTCFILISLFVQFELSYDTFHEKADRIYRIAKENPGKDYLGTNRFAVTPAPLVKALMEEFPEVEHATQVDQVNALLEYGNKKFYEDGIFATEHFFNVFSFPLLQGDPGTALAEPNSIILTESLAKKYFGDTNPVGQSMTILRSNEQAEMEIVGVAKDVPANSHFTFDYLISMSSWDSYAGYIDHWDSNNYLTYASLRPDHSLPDFTFKLSALARKYLSQYDYYQRHPDEITTYFPQALTDIHLRSHLNFEFGINGDIRYVYLFSAIALLILLIACINYMNLAMARSVIRAKEVGMRKVMGAHRGQLIGQFMGEGIIPSVVALIVAIVLVELLLPTFNTLTARQMSLNLIQNGGLPAILVLIGVGAGILAGSYPAFMMSSFHPIRVMTGNVRGKTGKTTLRNMLVVAQFVITILLIIGTIVIQKQLHYIQNTNTGIDRDHVVSVTIRDDAIHGRYPALKQTLLNHPNVLGVTASHNNPTRIASQSGTRRWEGAEEGQHISIYHMPVQHDFIDLFGIELVKGRDFSEAITTDGREGMLINETLARQLGWEEPIGKWLYLNGRDGHIIGVMKDFNFQSFHQKMGPLALYLDTGQFSHVLVKVRQEEMQETITFLSETMAEFSPEYPFEYQFLDDAYNRMYQTEIRLGGLFNYFTVIALLIACLGLFGLVAFTTSRRTKEIGVRKVLGATVTNIVTLLSKDFLKLVLLGFVIAVPIAWYAMNQWLADFVYRIEIGPGIFAIAGGAALLIALATVSWQSIKAALMNPVNSLRNE